jgi:hypothetical protein
MASLKEGTKQHPANTPATQKTPAQAALGAERARILA